MEEVDELKEIMGVGIIVIIAIVAIIYIIYCILKFICMVILTIIAAILAIAVSLAVIIGIGYLIWILSRKIWFYISDRIADNKPVIWIIIASVIFLLSLVGGIGLGIVFLINSIYQNNIVEEITKLIEDWSGRIAVIGVVIIFIGILIRALSSPSGSQSSFTRLTTKEEKQMNQLPVPYGNAPVLSSLPGQVLSNPNLLPAVKELGDRLVLAKSVEAMAQARAASRQPTNEIIAVTGQTLLLGRNFVKVKAKPR